MTKRNLSEWWDDLDEDGPETPQRTRPTKASQKPHPGNNPIDRDLAWVASEDHHAGRFDFTYQASRHERQWLLQSLGNFYEHHWIRDVLRQVKGGKEASVYLCESQTGESDNLYSAGLALPELLAAKVYRPRMLRSLKNDALYRENRGDLDAEGHEIMDHRMLRAIQKRTAFGQELRHTSWLEHEYTALQALTRAGADVPVPYASESNAILMTYIGEDGLPAPTLASVHLTRTEAEALFQRTLRNIEIMLSQDIIHGDLSAFNILYWDGAITLIDFPQVVHPEQNRSAFRIFERDVVRICEYFQRQGVRTQPRRLAADLWTSYQHSLLPDINPALLDDQDEQDVAYWKSLAEPAAEPPA
jgi:RIO kinase 1